VASFIGAAKNDVGAHGVAFNSTLFVARTDDGTSCGTDGCNHNDNDIAAGVNAAVSSGARVINLSLGGSPANSTLRNAISNATAQGVILVFSAGNDGSVSPDPFPNGLFNIGIDRGLIVIAGATDASGVITSFSNRAGGGASRNFYITAPGTGLWATGPDGRNFTVQGTSFAAPHVAGALALVLQAFPTLTSTQAVDLILRTATDTEAAGIDEVTGRGFLNIERAFQPQGSSSVSTGMNGNSVSVTAVAAVLANGFADSGKLGSALKNVVFLDGYGRPYLGDFSSQISKSQARLGLRDILRQWQGTKTVDVATDAINLTVTARQNLFARPELRTALSPTIQDLPGYDNVLAHAEFNISPSATVHFAQGIDAIGLTKRIASTSHFVTTDAARVQSLPQFGLALTTGTDAWRWRFGAAKAHIASLRDDTRSQLTSAAIGLDHIGHKNAFGLTLQAQEERGSVLGSFAGDGLSFGSKARSINLESTGRWQLSSRMSLVATAAVGRVWTTTATGSLVEKTSELITSSAALTAEYAGLLADEDRLALRLAQPLRVEHGGAALLLPVAYDYAARQQVFDRRFVSLTPAARELSLETSYARSFGALGDMQVNIFQRFNAGHQDGSDQGVLVRWRTEF
jgi:hypothetical protein